MGRKGSWYDLQAEQTRHNQKGVRKQVLQMQDMRLRSLTSRLMTSSSIHIILRCVIDFDALL